MTEEGKNVWIFPDGDLPEKDLESGLEAHEALMVLNTSKVDAHLSLTFYFSDKEPLGNIHITVPSERVTCFRMDVPEEIGGLELPKHTQYALKLESDVKVVATFGRLDTASHKMAYYTSAWYNA